MNTTLIAPVSLWGTQLQTSEGNYNIAADGYVTVSSLVAVALLGAGFTLAGGVGGGNGLTPVSVPLLSAFCQDGAPLAAAAAAGDFGVTCTPGTVLELISEAATSETKTDKALWEITLPQGYVAGEDITITLDCQVNGAGTSDDSTIDLSAYLCAVDGTGTDDLVSTAAQIIATGAAEYAFVIDGATLSPGDRLLVVATMAVIESAASAITGVISSVVLS